MKISENFSEVKPWVTIKGNLTENFFFGFLCSKWLNFENWAKKIFSKKNFFFRKKNFRAPQKWPFSAIFREPKFSRTCGFLQKFRNDLFYRFKPFPDKTNAKFFWKVPKTSKTSFWPFLAKKMAKLIFFRKSGSVSNFYLIFPNFSQKIRKN